MPMYNSLYVNISSDNIFDIWRYLGKGTPFIVRRNVWYHMSYMVTKVNPCGRYGSAYGYKLHDGKPKDGNTDIALINCDGCGNWELIENLIEDVDSLKFNCIDAEGNLTFGKYKGKNVDDVCVADRKYFDWAWCNIGGFSDLYFCRKYGVTLRDLYNVKVRIKGSLSISSDDWIKSPVKSNFDFILDQYKYSCLSGQKDIETAVKEIEDTYNNSFSERNKLYK